MNCKLRQALPQDSNTVAGLMVKLWPQNSLEEMKREAAEIAADSNAAIFLCDTDEADNIGFAQVSLRHDYVEGTSSSPVGYLEDIYVGEAFRGEGAAKKLLIACENWALEKGCSEFASDCELTNFISQDFHIKCGFEEANRIICFKKRL